MRDTHVRDAGEQRGTIGPDACQYQLQRGGLNGLHVGDDARPSAGYRPRDSVAQPLFGLRDDFLTQNIDPTLGHRGFEIPRKHLPSCRAFNAPTAGPEI